MTTVSDNKVGIIATVGFPCQQSTGHSLPELVVNQVTNAHATTSLDLVLQDLYNDTNLVITFQKVYMVS